jgi:hypothetical protein
MATIDASSVYNIEATLNAWLRAALATYTRPADIGLDTAPPVITDVPDRTAAFPSWSIHHIGASTRDVLQGRVTDGVKSGVWASGLMEANCWVTRGHTSWMAQLRWMHSAVLDVVAGTSGVVVKDYASDPYNPADTAYRVIVGDAQTTATGPDPNPDVERRRVLVGYRWVLRS